MTEELPAICPGIGGDVRRDRHCVAAQTTNSGGSQLNAFVRRAGIIIEPVPEEPAHIARQAIAACACAVRFSANTLLTRVQILDCCSQTACHATDDSSSRATRPSRSSHE
jgi:hypothetical protein